MSPLLVAAVEEEVTSDEIRKKNDEWGEKLAVAIDVPSASFLVQTVIAEILVEIAAQLAEMNEKK